VYLDIRATINTHHPYNHRMYTHWQHTLEKYPENKMTPTPRVGMELSYNAYPYNANKSHQCSCAMCTNQHMRGIEMYERQRDIERWERQQDVRQTEYQKNLERYYQQEQMACSQSHDTASRFRFHDMCHGNTMSNFYAAVHRETLSKIKNKMGQLDSY
jgi:hypothetical protein